MNWCRCCAVVLFVGIVGCGGQEDAWTAGREKTFAVTGTVLRDGEPVEGAIVLFHSTEVNQTASPR